MFKNREFRIRIAKTGENDTELVEPSIQISKEDVIDVADTVLKKAAIYVGSVIVLTALAHSASEIAIHHGTKS